MYYSFLVQVAVATAAATMFLGATVINVASWDQPIADISAAAAAPAGGVPLVQRFATSPHDTSVLRAAFPGSCAARKPWAADDLRAVLAAVAPPDVTRAALAAAARATVPLEERATALLGDPLGSTREFNGSSDCDLTTVLISVRPRAGHEAAASRAAKAVTAKVIPREDLGVFYYYLFIYFLCLYACMRSPVSLRNHCRHFYVRRGRPGAVCPSFFAPLPARDGDPC